MLAALKRKVTLFIDSSSQFYTVFSGGPVKSTSY